MLQQMRDWFRYLKWLLVVVVFMFIVWAFASWSGGSSGGRQAEVSWAAKVNGTVIETTRFQSYARQLESTYQSIFGDQFAQQRGLIKIGQQAINQLVDDEIIYQAALGAGLQVSPEEVAQAITRDPSFQENGRFIGAERYNNLFRGARMNVEDFEEQLRRRLLVERYRDLVGNGVTVSDAEIEQEFLRKNARVSVDWVVIDPAAIPEGSAPDDAALSAWYESHKDRYMRGEGRTGIYALVDPAAMATPATVTDAEIRAAYDRDLATRYAVREQRRASHILFKVPSGASEKDVARIQAKARDVLKRIKAGADFGEMARRNSEDSTASSGGDLGFFGRGQMVKEFDDAAFSLPVGSVSELVRTTYGLHIIKVTDEHAPRTMPLDEVKDAIRGEIANTRARSLALERAAALATAAAGGRLEAAAQAQGLKTRDTGPVHPGDALQGLPASQPAVMRMFSLEPGQTSESIAVPSGQVVVQVTGTLADEPRPFQEVKARVIKEILDDRRRTAVRARVLTTGSGGLAAIAKSFKVELKHQDDLAPDAGLPGLPRDADIDRQIETLSPGIPGDPLVTSAGLVVLSVRERKDHHDDLAAQKEATRNALLTQQRERMLRALVQRLRAQGSVEINRPLVDAIDRG
jgi:peptidyl-prolyl cis-trans isomerase D